MNNDEKTRLSIVHSKHNGSLTVENKAKLNELEIFKDNVSFQFKNGWVDLVYEIGKNITELCNLVNCKLPIVQRVTSKYATLRFDYYFDSKVPPIIERFIDSLLYEAEDKSERICEICGEDGELRVTKSGSWYFTLCNKHKDDYLTIKEFEKKYQIEKIVQKDEIINKLKKLKPLYLQKGLEMVCILDEKEYSRLTVYYKLHSEIMEKSKADKSIWLISQLEEILNEIKMHFKIKVDFELEKNLNVNDKVVYI